MSRIRISFTIKGFYLNPTNRTNTSLTTAPLSKRIFSQSIFIKPKKIHKSAFASSKLLMAFFIIGLQTACSLLQDRSQHRQTPDSIQKNQKNNSSINKTFQKRASSKSQLKKMESSIATRKEIEQYSKALPSFENEEERIEFLNLPDFESKQLWLNDRNFSQRSKNLQEEMADLVEAKDIALGMPSQLVKKSWGEPDVVEVSGNPQFKNERWRYHKYISTNDGYKPEKKIVYFEGGKVVGWEIE